MTDAPRPDDDMLAAEYALGLLEGEELLAARGREASDPVFAAAVAWWQDRLAYLLDPGAIEHGGRLTSRFLTALSALAMGFQLLVMCLLLWVGRSDVVLFYFAVPAMLYTLGLIGYRRFFLTRRSG